MNDFAWTPLGEPPPVPAPPPLPASLEFTGDRKGFFGLASRGAGLELVTLGFYRFWEFFKRIWWLWLVVPLALFLFPLLPFLYAHYKAVEWRWWLSGIRFGAVSVESRLEPNALQGLYWKTIGWYMLLGTVFASVLGGVSALVFKLGGGVPDGAVGPDALMQNIPLLVVTVVGYMAMALALSVVTRLYLTRDLWAKVLATTVVTNISAAANVTARGDLATAVGEGIADGLDVAGF